MELERTFLNIRRINRALIRLYGLRYRCYCDKWEQSNPMPQSIFGDGLHFINERMVKRMLNFKNANGEIVMTEKDNGDLSIHDDILKESLKEQISLEEAAKKVNKED